ncbi:MAG: hypothetical protein LBR10_03400 [Prevotellaceae bacterium]|nr:hypothetical protein [Prevotellaceae bacterium]
MTATPTSLFGVVVIGGTKDFKDFKDLKVLKVEALPLTVGVLPACAGLQPVPPWLFPVFQRTDCKSAQAVVLSERR